MAQIPVVSNSYIGDGTTKRYDLTFVYLTKAEVFANVNGVSTPFTWVAGSGSSIEFAVAPPALATIRIYRSTLAYAVLRVFENGVPFLPRYIDENNRQILYVAQEAISTSTAAMDIANTVLVRINVAESVAAAADTKASTALTTANNASTVASAADTKANTAISTANGIDSKATLALSNSAAAQVVADAAADLAQEAIDLATSQGVSSFNGRQGPVVPVSGDYTADQVTYESGSVGSFLTAITAFARSLLTAASAAIARDTLQISDGWATQPIGSYVAVQSSLAGMVAPPTNRGYRYILLSAASSYNSGALTNETLSGATPLNTAVATIAVPGSPINGQVIRLINTERRTLRAGQDGVIQQDAFQDHTHTIPLNSTSTINGYASFKMVSTVELTGSIGNASTGRPDSTETRVKNVGVTYYMRVL